MRRLSFHLLVAIVTFSVSAVSVNEFDFQEVDSVASQDVVILQINEISENSTNMIRPTAEENFTPDIPESIKREMDVRFPNWQFPKLDPEIGKYLREYDSPEAHPAFISGDFDGNGHVDYAFFIEYGAASLNSSEAPEDFHSVLGVFFRKGDKFKYCQLLHTDFKIDHEDYIARIKKGERGYNYETDKHFIYKTDAIFSGIWEKAGSSFIYENRKFREITTSD